MITFFFFLHDIKHVSNLFEMSFESFDMNIG
jgi:hypothetical protein